MRRLAVVVVGALLAPVLAHLAALLRRHLLQVIKKSGNLSFPADVGNPELLQFGCIADVCGRYFVFYLLYLLNHNMQR